MSASNKNTVVTSSRIKRGRKRPLCGYKFKTTPNEAEASDSTIDSHFTLSDIVNPKTVQNDRQYREQERKEREEKIAQRRRRSSQSDVVDKSGGLHLSPNNQTYLSLPSKDNSKASNVPVQQNKFFDSKLAATDVIQNRSLSRSKEKVKNVSSHIENVDNVPGNKNVSASVSVAHKENSKIKTVGAKSDKIAVATSASRKLPDRKPAKTMDYSNILQQYAVADDCSGSDVFSNVEGGTEITEDLQDFSRVLRTRTVPSSVGGTYVEKTTTTTTRSPTENLTEKIVGVCGRTQKRLSYAGHVFNSDESPTFSNVFASTPVNKPALTSRIKKSDKPADNSRRISFSKKVLYRSKTPETQINIDDEANLKEVDNNNDVFTVEVSGAVNSPPDSDLASIQSNHPNIIDVSKTTSSTTKQSSGQSTRTRSSSKQLSIQNIEPSDVSPIDSLQTDSSIGFRRNLKRKCLPVESDSLDEEFHSTSIKHYAETTGSVLNDNAAITKRKRISFQSFLEPPKLIVPNPEKFTPGCRRSTRTRVPKLRGFAGERIKYEPIEDDWTKGNKIVGIEKVIIDDRLAKKYGSLPPPPRCERDRMQKGVKSSKSKLNVTARNLSIHVDNVENVPNIDARASVLDKETGKLKSVDCYFFKDESIYVDKNNEPAAENDSVVYLRRFSTKEHSSGNILLRPFASYNEFAPCFTDFFIIFGKLTVTVNKTERILQSGDSFYVPAENKYKIRNLRADEAKLYYVQIKH